MTTFVPPNRPLDGIRNGAHGWWISEAETKERTVGNEEWWKMEGITGKTVELKQYSRKSPKDRPIWFWGNGNMYLGEWKRKAFKRYPLCHGFGAYYRHGPEAYNGWIYIGKIKDGKAHGFGKQFWLESAPSWEENRFTGSAINENGTGRPYVYSGRCVNNFQQDETAAVTLKDGTTRGGPWKRGRPVGDWYKDHRSLAAAIPTSQTKLSTLQLNAKEPATMPTASTIRVSPSSTIKQAPPREASLDDRKPSAQSDNCSEIHLTAQNTLQNISPSDSNDNDDSFQCLSSQGQANISLKECRVEKITEWLTSVIGFDPVQAEMDVYARIFYDLGLHSVEMIVNLCTKADVEEFDWMKKFHRDRVAAALPA